MKYRFSITNLASRVLARETAFKVVRGQGRAFLYCLSVTRTRATSTRPKFAFVWSTTRFSCETSVFRAN